MLSYQEKYQLWCTSPAFDKETQNELLCLSDEKEIEDRFYKDLDFGTAGLRGIMGAGTNRVNRYTVGKATLGLAKYLLETDPDTEKKGVVIGYDTRNASDFLAKCAADVLTAMNIPVYLFDQAVPTPVLSYSVRRFGTASGIVITASHNPPAYNGYKVYDPKGYQLGIEQADAVLAKMNQIEDWSSIPAKGNDSLLTKLGDSLLNEFTNEVLKQSTFSDRKAKENLKLVFTPIHGTGRKPIAQILEKDGFSDVIIVPEQEMPDGNFPTVKSPNPEERDALLLGIELATSIGADLVIGSDPDADRIGCAVNHNGQMTLLSGNQVGALLVDFLLKTKTVLGSNPVVISTIVTNDLGLTIAKANGCIAQQVLTGFKFIGEKVSAFEAEQQTGAPDAHHFILGYEDSYGYLAGTHARDKDAVVAAMLISEMVAFHKKNGHTLIDALEALYQEYGYYLDKVDSVTLQGKEGLERIAQIMEKLRADHSFLPNLEKTLDYNLGVEDLPPSNVLKFYLTGGSWIAVRPSGTEPKIKFYYCIREKDKETAQKTLSRLQEKIRKACGL